MVMRGTGGTPAPPPGYQPPPLPGVAAGSVNIFRGRLVIVFGPGNTVSGLFIYPPGTVPGPGNPPVVSATESPADPFGNPVSGGVVVGTSSNPQAQLQSVGGVGKLIFKLNNAGYTDPLIDGGFSAGIGALAIEGPASTDPAHDDFVLHVLSAADGVASHFANEQWAYEDINGVFRIYAFLDGTGFNATAVSQLTAADPTTGTGPGNPAVGETWHDLRPLTGSFVGTIAGRYPPQFRKTADGDVEIVGYVQLPASYNGVTFANVPSVYRPTANSGWKGAAFMETNPTANSGSPNIQVDTSGNLQLHNLGTGLSGTIVGFYMRYPLDNTGVIAS